MNILQPAQTAFRIAALCITVPLFFIFIGALNLLLDFLEDGASEPQRPPRERYAGRTVESEPSCQNLE
jgi:hypothetical protein